MSGDFEKVNDDAILLNQLIHSDDKRITLNRDFSLNEAIKITTSDIVIDGDGHIIDAGGVSQIFNIVGDNIVLKNIVFKNASTKKSGGAISNLKGNLEIINCKFLNNSSKGDGGAVYNWNGFLSVKNSVFINNESERNGGAIANGNEFVLLDSSFSNNNSNHNGESIFNDSQSNITLKNCNFERLDFSVFKDNLLNNEIFNRGMISIEADEDELKNFIQYGFVHIISDNVNSFKYFDNLIHSDKKTLTLDFDIEQLDEYDSYKNGILIDVDGLVIDGKGHSIDALGKTPIFAVESDNVILKNINFKNGFAKNGGAIDNKGNSLTLINCSFDNNISENGGAIINEGTINLKDCRFKNNYSTTEYGGAIQNNCDLILNDCSFENNISRNYGGAINNSKNLTLENCNFKGNVSNTGGAINNVLDGISNILKSDFTENMAFIQGNVIFNENFINIKECSFKNNFSNKGSFAISQMGNLDSEMNIESSSFTQKTLNDSLIFIENGFANIEYTKFDIDSNDSYILYNNDAILRFEKSEFVKQNDKAIFNDNVIKIRKEENIENLITSGKNAQPLRYLGEKLPSGWKGFCYLDKMIHSGENVITLDCDITMHDIEQDFYAEGIGIDIDNLVIDGNYHTIDANNLSRIFFIAGVNITIRNLRFKNGKYFKNKFDGENDGGGAIYAMPLSSLKIETCEFINNSSRKSAGAICNKSESIDLYRVSFKDNYAKDNCGAIYNENSRVKIENCDFLNNHSKKSGAIYSIDSSVNIVKANFRDNYANNCGAILNNNSFCNLKSCKFINNTSKDSAGAVLNHGGDLELINCIFSDNESVMEGGAIYNELADLTLTDCRFLKNSSKNGGGISNIDADVTLTNCSFNDNEASNDGGAINNIRNCNSNFKNCNFDANTAERGGAISNLKKCKLRLESCDFNGNNSSGDAGGIYNWYGFLDIFQSSFLKNTADGLAGAIDNHFGSLRLTDSRICENKVKKNGGAIASSGTIDLIKDCLFKDNAALLNGGAIYTTQSSSGNIELSEFISNHAYGNQGSGGAFYISSLNNGSQMPSLTIRDCDFLDNDAAESAGSIFNKGFSDLKSCSFKETFFIKNVGTVVNKGNDAKLSVEKLKFDVLQDEIVNYSEMISKIKKKEIENLVKNKNGTLRFD